MGWPRNATTIHDLFLECKLALCDLVWRGRACVLACFQFSLRLCRGVSGLFITDSFGPARRVVPDDVNIQAFAKPLGGRFQLLVRVPFAALNDIQFPLRGEAGYLDLAHIDSALPGAAKYWIGDSIRIFENGELLPKPEVMETRVAFASDKSFASYQDALAHLRGPKLPADTQAPAAQSSLDILFEYPIHSDRSSFSIRTQLAHLGARVSVDLRFLPPGGTPHDFSYEGDPGLIRLDPRGGEVARQFVSWGFFHVLNGTDYLLFLFCLVLPFPRLRTILPMACAFALSNSVTLIASALGQAPDALWFPPLIETAIAVTILYVALENIAGGVTLWRRTIIAAVFGLVYGFSFAFGLASKLNMAGAIP